MKKTIIFSIIILATQSGFGQLCFPVYSIGSESIYNRKLFSFNNMSYPIGFPLVLSSISDQKNNFTHKSAYTKYHFTTLVLYPNYKYTGFAFSNEDVYSRPGNNTLSIGLDNTAGYNYKYSRLWTQSSGLTLLFLTGTQHKRQSIGNDGGAVYELSTIKRPLIITGSLDYLWAANHLTKLSANGNDYQKQKNKLIDYTNRWQYSIGVEAGISYAWIRVGYSNSLFKEEYQVPTFLSKARICIGVNLLKFL